MLILQFYIVEYMVYFYHGMMIVTHYLTNNYLDKWSYCNTQRYIYVYHVTLLSSADKHLVNYSYLKVNDDHTYTQKHFNTFMNFIFITLRNGQCYGLNLDDNALLNIPLICFHFFALKTDIKYGLCNSHHQLFPYG